MVCSGLFLLSELRGKDASQGALRHDSQLSEAVFLLRHNYVRPLKEAPLLEGAVETLRLEATRLGIAAERLPEWEGLEGATPEEGLDKVERYLAQVSLLDPEKFPMEKAVYAAISGLVKALSDPYTAAMDPKAFARFQESLHSHVYGGAGIELEWTKGAYVVFEVAPNSPASGAKILPGDRVLEVDGIELSPTGKSAVTLLHARALLMGEVGTKLKIRLSRGGVDYRRELTLSKFESRSVTGRMVGEPDYGEPRVGWIAVNSLGEQTGKELVETVARLEKLGAQGYVLDLRDNVGGYLNAAVEVASYWLPSGQPMVYVEGRTGEKLKQTIGVRPQMASLVLLVNSRTASSAEILAAGLREHGRAYVLGDRTFGKGSIQTVYDFVDGGGFKMTTATYLTPSRKGLEGRGLSPDHTVDVSQGRDEALIQQDVLSLCMELWRKDPSEP